MAGTAWKASNAAPESGSACDAERRSGHGTEDVLRGESGDRGEAGAENEAIEQVAFADRLLLNKTDLVTEDDLERIETRLRAINRFAPIQRTVQSGVSVESVLDIRGFDLQAAMRVRR